MSTDATVPDTVTVPSPLHTRPGFVADASGIVAAHYGNPMAEQRPLSAGLAVVDLSDRGVLAVSGADRLSWLNSLTSQSLLGLPPGVSTETLLLDASGRLEHAARLLDDGETVWLLVDRAEVEPLRSWLDRMRFMLRVEVADRTAEYATLGSLADVALPIEVAAPNDVPLVWVDPWATVTAGGHGYAAETGHPGHDWTYRETLVARADLDALAASDVPVAGTLALEALRIEAWRPRLSTEVDEKTIPHELDWLRSAVHLTKGCYRGQETVAKVHNLGHPPRRLVMLHLDGSDNVLPQHGDAVVLPVEAGADDTAEPKQVGRVTSVAVHHELGPVALAVVKRTTPETAALAVLAADTVVAAAQQTIVPPDAGASAGVPRLPRLGSVTR
ncbi:YgfZ/GcvT domain-containing protein [Frigoribacterium sp. 2-23]|uniref:CAF17-like 4Fe-4S cluster assembly/insertion protein YgfZ n=1 Tax=Frigoribacterium sp. 2-23 TaxID=3415006 RepID=UPI003C703C51